MGIYLDNFDALAQKEVLSINSQGVRLGARQTASVSSLQNSSWLQSSSALQRPGFGITEGPHICKSLTMLTEIWFSVNRGSCSWQGGLPGWAHRTALVPWKILWTSLFLSFFVCLFDWFLQYWWLNPGSHCKPGSALPLSCAPSPYK